MSILIRAPLSGILGFTDVIRRGIGAFEQHDECPRRIQTSGKHLPALINDVLDLSKIEAGHMECERVRCSPNEVLSEVLSVLRVRAQEIGLRLESQWTTPVPATILSDPARLRQLLMNLAANAIKFTERGSVTIRMAAYLSGDFPNGKSVYTVFWRWRKNGVWRRIREALCRPFRRQSGKKPTSNTVIIDSQSVHTAEGGSLRANDSGKKITVRKRHIVVDTLGLIWSVVVHEAA